MTDTLDQVWSDRDRCCWEWRFVSRGFGALICHWSEELLLLVTMESSTLRGAVWSGISPYPDRAALSTCCPVPALDPGLSIYSHGKGNLPGPPMSPENMHQDGYESATESHVVSL